MANDVEIVGLPELKRAFRNLPKEVRKETANAMLPVARKVADTAASKVPVVSGDARGSFTAKATAAGASVGAYKDVPYGKWLDFGSRTPRTGNNRAEGPWRGSGPGPKGGRFLYPALNEHNAEIIEAAGDAIDRAAPEAGWQ